LHDGIGPPFVSRWIYAHKLRLIEHALVQGITLDLYSEEELPQLLTYIRKICRR
jgi:hypothetical protein